MITSLLFNLSAMPFLGDFETRSISAENPDGRRSGGAKATPIGGPARDLGLGWKVRPFITLEPQTTITLADVKGSGMIQHIWITCDSKLYRDCVLRFYWDDETEPSVEVPLGDFFANGHGLRYNVNSLPVAVNPAGAFNCYWPMPFYHSARITLENQRAEDDFFKDFFFQITYALGELPPDMACFHAQYRHSQTRRDNPEHIILDGVVGDGQYVGTHIDWTQLSDGWWGEGEVKFFVDGDKEHPTICGTGTEDYFGGAWGFNNETFCAPFSGRPLWERETGKIPKHGLYRWHIPDPIRFKRDLKVTVQTLGWWPGPRYQPLADEIASVAYWYQREPHTRFPDFPSRDARLPR
jgi:hypothetical protein